MRETFDLAGPIGPDARLAVAVSGGADSMALAVLAQDYCRARGGSVLALVVDHGLRAESAAEARMVCQRLQRLGLPARVLTLAGVERSAAAARQGRYQALDEACADAGIVHLLLGHHAADQAETVQIRALCGSGDDGLAAMAVRRDGHRVSHLRPLLAWSPLRLRQVLTERGIEWIEDPSNASPLAQRGRLRALSQGIGVTALCEAAAASGVRRAVTERRVAAWLAEHAQIFPQGFALIPPGKLPQAALAALLQMISGAPYRPNLAQVATLAAQPRASSLGGVTISKAGRLGAGWLLAREWAAVGPPVPAREGVVWDRRFRLSGALPAGASVAALGDEAAGLRRRSDLPARVLRSLPAIRQNEVLVAVPHIGYSAGSAAEALRLQFSPACPAACAPWLGTQDGLGVRNHDRHPMFSSD